MSRAEPRKLRTYITINHKVVVMWSDRPDMLTSIQKDGCENIQSLKWAPSRITVRYLGELARKTENPEVINVYFDYILRSDYWQETSHPRKSAEYREVEGVWKCVKRKQYSE